jgi:hypothetical protein
MRLSICCWVVPGFNTATICNSSLTRRPAGAIKQSGLCSDQSAQPLAIQLLLRLNSPYGAFCSINRFYFFAKKVKVII